MSETTNSPVRGSAGAAPGTDPNAPKSKAEKRRDRLQSLAREREDYLAETEAARVAPGPPHPATLNEVQDAELVNFIQGLVERDQNRKQQLGMLKNFLDNPLEFGLDSEVIPTSSTPEEIAARRKDLTYRISLMENLLEIMRSELNMLERAETPNS